MLGKFQLVVVVVVVVVVVIIPFQATC